MDLTIGGYELNAKRSKTMEPSLPYTYEAIFFATSEKLHKLQPFKLNSPFTWDLWTVLILIGLFICGIIALAKYLPTEFSAHIITLLYRNSPYLNVLNSFLGGNVVIGDHLRHSYAPILRGLFLVWLFTCIILRGAYQGNLYNFFQNRELNSLLDTVDKVFQSTCDIHISVSSKKELQQYIFDTNRIKHYNKSTTRFDILAQFQSGEKTGVILCKSTQFTYFLKQHNRGDIIRRTTDRLHLIPIVIYFPQTSYLIDPFNRQIQYIIQAGLIEKWKNDYIFYGHQHYLTYRKQKRYQTDKPLGLKSFESNMITFGVLWLLSIFIFALELLSNRVNAIRTAIDHLTY